jgi:uncharacterized protein
MAPSLLSGGNLSTICFDATIDRVDGGYSSAAERLTVAQDVVGSIPTSRPKVPPEVDGNEVYPISPPGQSCDASLTVLQTREPAETPAGFTPFEPHPWLLNGHLQTIVGNFLPRPCVSLPAVAETVEVDPADGSRVLCHCHWQPEPERAGGSRRCWCTGSRARPIRATSGHRRARLAAGMNVVRMNMRNCGGSDALTPTLYHSGRSADVGAVVRHFTARFGLERVALVGYSMGGNLVLKLAGEWGARRRLSPSPRFARPSISLPAPTLFTNPPTAATSGIFCAGNLMRASVAKPSSFPPSIKSTASAPFAPSASSTRNRRALLRLSATPTTTTTAPPAPASSTASPFPRSSSAPDDPFIRLFPETRARILANPHIDFVESATAATAPSSRAAFRRRSLGRGHRRSDYLQAVAADSPPWLRRSRRRIRFTSQLQ